MIQPGFGAQQVFAQVPEHGLLVNTGARHWLILV